MDRFALSIILIFFLFGKAPDTLAADRIVGG